MDNNTLTLFQQIMDERFKGLHIQMDTEFKLINEKLSQIKEQTTKTNARVTHLEEDVNKLKQGELSHIIACPQIKVIKELKNEVYNIENKSNNKFEQLHNDLEDYRIIKKYPKIALSILTVTCVGVIIGALLILARLNNEVKAQTYKTPIESVKK